MKTITVTVNDQFAEKMDKMDPKHLGDVLAMAETLLNDNRSLEQVIRSMQGQAEKNGLTQERLDQILRELE